MITKELRESAVELNTIFENCSEQVLKKIPSKLRKFFREIASDTYKFNYDSNKSLNEQNLKPKTRRLIALIYKDYLCTMQEREQYIIQLSSFFEEQKKLKEKKYNTTNIFKKEKQIDEEVKGELIVQESIKAHKNTLISKIIKFLQKLKLNN